ncbi:TPA: ABC transporter permease subunit [Salmonella enterica]|uniref:Glutamate/aspartate import permease protein GltK n=1 Tax=Salmonella enterica TaxID=28901 RepID=A0A744HED3_SALER|nr:ABC transporter permease subunit [Salmonella enterica]HAF4920025.1 ABC transporter permease subunit [Salmonella enterica]
MFDMDWQTLADSKHALFAGMAVTLQIMCVAILCGLALGIVLAMLHRSSQRWVRAFAQGYVALFRAIPLVMLLLWFFLIVPQFLKALFNLPATIDIRLLSAMVAYSMLEAAFFCEIVRAGIDSLPHGQTRAAQALGMTAGQAMRYVILPQAFRAMLPLALTQCIVIFQDTSLVYVIALGDFFRRMMAIGERDGTVMPILLLTGVVYWLISAGMTVIVKAVRTRLAE